MTTKRPAPRKQSATRRTLAVGLTGGIASGKSEVASVFRELGALVISADREAKDMLGTDPAVMKKIGRLLGPRAYKAAGKPDRKFIARRIFSNVAERRKVNAIIHPAVISRIRQMIAREKRAKKFPLVAVEAALIYEAGMARMFDAVVVIDSPLRERVARIRRRDGVSGMDALRRIRAQKSSRSKAAMADIVISNRSDLRSLRTAGRCVYRLLAGAEEGMR